MASTRFRRTVADGSLWRGDEGIAGGEATKVAQVECVKAAAPAARAPIKWRASEMAPQANAVGFKGHFQVIPRFQGKTIPNCFEHHNPAHSVQGDLHANIIAISQWNSQPLGWRNFSGGPDDPAAACAWLARIRSGPGLRPEARSYTQACGWKPQLPSSTNHRLLALSRRA